MHKMTKATLILPEVKREVAERDSIDGHCCCIFCGSPEAAPVGHIVRRSQGGEGVPANIISVCGKCHYRFDESSHRDEMFDFAVKYIKQFYPDWTVDGVTYSRWRDFVK